MIIDADTLVGFWPGRKVDISVERLLGLMARYGVDRACVCSARGVCYDYLEGNAETQEIVSRYPNFIPVATLDPREYISCGDEIRRQLALGTRLFRLFPEYQGWNHSSPAARRVMQMLQDSGAILMIGGAPPGGLPEICALESPVILTGAHFYQLADVLACAEEYPHIYVSTRLLIAPGAIDVTAAHIGHERLIFGSHAPLVYQAAALRTVQAANLNPAQRDAVLGGNLLRLLGGTDADH